VSRNFPPPDSGRGCLAQKLCNLFNGEAQSALAAFTHEFCTTLSTEFVDVFCGPGRSLPPVISHPGPRLCFLIDKRIIVS
jgi:hypothetical protein